MTSQGQYNCLILRYKEPKYFPPRPSRTIGEMRKDDEKFWEAYQVAFDHFFYSDFLIEGKEMAEEFGIEFTQEFYEEMFDLGMFQFGMTDNNSTGEKFVSLLYWTGCYYREEGRL